jgi:hypothetical protein
VLSKALSENLPQHPLKVTRIDFQDRQLAQSYQPIRRVGGGGRSCWQYRNTVIDPQQFYRLFDLSDSTGDGQQSFLAGR